MKREHVLRLAHLISDVACGNDGIIDHAHKPETCPICGRIADLMIDFFTPDPDPFAENVKENGVVAQAGHPIDPDGR